MAAKEKKAYLYINYANIVVLQGYMNVIKDALVQTGYVCEFTKSLTDVPKQDLIVFPMGKDAFRYYMKGYRNFVLWQQGVTGEESFMRHQSKVRRAVLNYMDCFAMKKAKMIFFVSQYMKEYYERLSGTDYSDKAYVMPCFNETLDLNMLSQKNYSAKVFSYVGSLDLWQCFEETADVYAEIERRIPDAFFKVLTFNIDKADQILRGKGIRNYSVVCVPKDQVRDELSDVTYGFILRHNIEVNRVATPTKISSYLSAGVLPIYSPCLVDFHGQASKKHFAFGMSPKDNVEELVKFVNTTHEPDVLQQEIRSLFRTYYSPDYHIQLISALARKCLNK